MAEEKRSHNQCDNDDVHKNFGKNERLVHAVLSDAEEPLKAYEILHRLKDKGVRAPMTVYRALHRLEGWGLVHKVDGINAYVLCKHAKAHSVQAFFVCENCARVIELDMVNVEADILSTVDASGFEMRSARLEVKGNCGQCAKAA